MLARSVNCRRHRVSPPPHTLSCRRFVLQNLASGNWVKMPCSTYSVGLRLIASVGFWDVGVESVPEDYHTALKIFWGTGGRARLEPIYHPVMYQHIDGGSWLGGVHQRFLQVRRGVDRAVCGTIAGAALACQRTPHRSSLPAGDAYHRVFDTCGALQTSPIFCGSRFACRM